MQLCLVLYLSSSCWWYGWHSSTLTALCLWMAALFGTPSTKFWLLSIMAAFVDLRSSDTGVHRMRLGLCS